MEASFARRMWRAVEPYHAVVYFAPETKSAFAAAGFKGWWMGYFATRSAPMGAVSAATVAATFYNFHPRMVQRAIPDAWTFSSPQRALDARLEIVSTYARRVLNGMERHIETALPIAADLAAACVTDGRPLAAANQAVGLPDDPYLALWQATTTLREHRGDGHVTALTGAQIDGCEAHVTFAAAGGPPLDLQRTARGWTEADWDAAVERLRARGLLDRAGGLTDAGRSVRERVEDETDRLALPPYREVGEAACLALESALAPVADALRLDEVIPYPNPMGLSPD